jgi:hypothetical protein
MTLDAIFLALTVPARSGWHAPQFVEDALSTLKWFVPGKERHYTLHLDEGNQEVVQEMEALLAGWYHLFSESSGNAIRLSHLVSCLCLLSLIVAFLWTGDR